MNYKWAKRVFHCVKKKIYFSVMVFFCLFSGITAEITIVSEDAPPYNYVDGEEVKGVSTEVVKNLFKELKMPLPNIGIYPWARAYNMALEKENLLIYSITRIEEREKLFKWVGEVAPVKVHLYKLKSRTDIKLSVLDDAKRYIVGAARKDSKLQYLQRKGIEFNESEIVVRDELNLLKLKAKRVDLIPFEELRLAHICSKSPDLNFNDFEKVFPLKELNIDVSIAFSLKTSDETVNKFKKALVKLKENGIHQKILQKYIK